MGGDGVSEGINPGHGLVLRDPLSGLEVEPNVKVLVFAAGENGDE